jgi:hypothetical protein
MFKITGQQLKTFSKALMESFERDASFRLRRRYPLSTKELSDEQLAALIRHGRVQAEKYDILEVEDTHVFLEYMAVLGKDFDTNPEHKWASRILRIRNLQGTEKTERLKLTHPLKQEFA